MDYVIVLFASLNVNICENIAQISGDSRRTFFGIKSKGVPSNKRRLGRIWLNVTGII